MFVCFVTGIVTITFEQALWMIVCSLGRLGSGRWSGVLGHLDPAALGTTLPWCAATWSKRVPIGFTNGI